MDRLDFFEGYIKQHRDHIIKDLASLDSKNNELIKLINETRLAEMDHILDCIDDINNKTLGGRR